MKKSYNYPIKTQSFIKKIKIINFTNKKNTNKHDKKYYRKILLVI